MTFELEAGVRRRTRRVLVIAAAVVAVVLVGGVLAFYAGRGSGGHGGPSAAAPTTAATPAPAGSGPTTGSTSAGAGGDLGPVTWMDVRGMTLPVSASHGPTQRTDGRAGGFSRDRAGAVLAAVHITIRADAIVGPAVFTPTIRDQVTGVDAPALAAAVQTDYTNRAAKAGITGGQPLPETHVEMTGYALDSYTDTAAYVRLLVATPGPQAQGTLYVAFRLEVRWSGRDWQLVAPPGGQWRDATGQAPSTDGYTLFPTRR
jgi:hypothetical protein